MAVYVDGEIPEEGEQNCRNDVDEKHHKHRPLVVLCVRVCFFSIEGPARARRVLTVSLRDAYTRAGSLDA